MRFIILTLLLAFSYSGGLYASPRERWHIDSVSLEKIDARSQSRLAATITNEATATHVQIVSDVNLTRAGKSFISDGKLVVLGEAGKASAVVIFDIASRRTIDWFYCYSPQQISDDWIVYVEWYPSHATGQPKDVVLLYDLSKTAIENRLPSARRLNIPAGNDAAPVQVGIPIYPRANAQEHSYANRVQNSSESETVVFSASYLLLPKGRLVFVAARGSDFQNLSNYMVVVDLSSGMANFSIQILDIPKSELKKPGENPQFIQITGMASTAPDEVRLYVPESDYGVSSIKVQIPPS